MMIDVLKVAREVNIASGGAFDVTGAPLFNIWGFGTKKGVTRPATKAEIDSIMTFVGHDKLIVDEVAHRVKKSDPRMTIIHLRSPRVMSPTLSPPRSRLTVSMTTWSRSEVKSSVKD